MENRAQSERKSAWWPDNLCLESQAPSEPACSYQPALFCVRNLFSSRQKTAQK